MVVTKQGRPSTIFQYGSTEKFADKIKITYADLLAKGVTVKKINYFSPRGISQITKHIDALEDELDIAISIVDQAQFGVMASNGECERIFREFVATMIGSLESEDDKNITLDYPALYLSAWYKYENRTESNKTITNVADSLIIWALRNTDPVKDIFMTQDEIYDSIEKEFPSAKHTIKSIFRDRLTFLKSQRTKFSRQTIQKHKQGFCLPVETRRDFIRKNEDSKNTLLLAKASFLNRITEKITDTKKNEIVELLLHSVKHVFTKQGIKLTKNIIDDEEDSYNDIYLIDAIADADNDLIKYLFTNKDKGIVSKMLRTVFANPTNIEQEYLTRSSYLYIMNYIMHNNMDIISYFEERTKRLSLIVHSDILVLALSEQYLPKEGQHYRNMLEYLHKRNAKLIITEEALTEVYMQLHIATLSYQSEIEPYEQHFTKDTVRYIPVLMTRAYMYNKLDGLVHSWNEFLNNFCEPLNILPKNKVRLVKEDLKVYLTDKFQLDFLSSNDLKSKIDSKIAKQLAVILEPHKKKPIIAEHVANVNIYVSAMRKINKEISSNPFGYQTYWLTREKRVYYYAQKFFDDNELEMRTIMRPEFIMEQIMFTPDKESIAKSYSATFPTALGIQMSQQLSIDTFKKIMKKLKEVSKLDPSRTKAILNNVIQVAAEETHLTHNMAVYDHEELPDYHIEKLNGKIDIEDLFKKAEKNIGKSE